MNITVNFDNNCICCLSKGVLKSVHDYYQSEKKISYLDILVNDLHFQVILKDTFPSKICENCCLLLEKISNFKAAFLRGQDILNAVSENEIIIVKFNDDTNATEDIKIESITEENMNALENMLVESRDNKRSLYKQKQYSFLKEEKRKSNAPYICRICSTNFQTYTQLYKHVYNHRKTQKTKCPECSYVCSKSHLKVHIRKHTGDRPFVCEICKMTFTVKFNLDRHMNSVHDKHHMCELCGESFYNKGSLLIHLQDHEGMCKHDTIRKTCEQCIQEASKYTLNEYLCNFCGKKLKSKYSLEMHEYYHCKENKERHEKIVCKKCNKNYASMNCLKTHESLCHTEKKFSCEICSKKFTMQMYLTNHMKIHEDDNALICKICKKCFSRKNVLTRHMLLHTNIFPFRCNICLKMFRQKTHLRTHMVTHTKERKYQCDQCGRRFGVKGNLDKHIRGVHEKYIKEEGHETHVKVELEALSFQDINEYRNEKIS